MWMNGRTHQESAQAQTPMRSQDNVTLTASRLDENDF